MARFAENIRKANDDTKSIKDRAVNLRSCAVNLSHLAKSTRNQILDQVKQETGVDLNKVESVGEIETVSNWMLSFRCNLSTKMSGNQNIIDQCEMAIRSIKGVLTESEFRESTDYILKYDEWHLGLELVIDWLTEDDRKISESMFYEFERAYELMGRKSDERLKSLKEQVV